MNRRNSGHLWLIFMGIPPVVWLSLHLAPNLQSGIAGIVEAVENAMTHPFAIEIVPASLKAVLACIAIYGMCVGVALSSRRNTRNGEEHGSAKWGEAKAICQKYREKAYCQNILLTQHVRLGLDGRKHRRNLNILVIGGSGAGKTRFYCKPNLLQGNTSFVILDPKGELTRDTGGMLESVGYEVRVLDLIHMEDSFCYNPFRYIENDNDAQRLVTNLFKSTTPKGSSSNDPFWDTAAQMLLMALVLYLVHEAPPQEQNFQMVLELLAAGEVKEDNDSYQSTLDILFYQLAAREPNHIAVKYYNSYHSGSGKTLKSIQITLLARLEKFNLRSLAALTTTDELDLPSLGEKKVALFAQIPDNDSSFNFLVSILYTQLFQQLFSLADRKYSGSLPVHVHFLMDEFANVSLPDDFEKILSVMRSREVSCSIILQNLAQLKALFDKQWESIVGNCDSLLYLGGNEKETHKYISELLGKETLDTSTHGKTKGRNGSFSTNYQQTGRELLTPDEVRVMNNDNAILFIRGERPILDQKYNILKHPNKKLSTDGGAAPYHHGGTASATASIVPERAVAQKTEATSISDVAISYAILSSEELDDTKEEPI